MVAPAGNGSPGASPTGGFSARCMDPNRLVWPMVATAFAGTSTPGSTENSMSACQSRTVILRTLPTTTSLIITGEFGSNVATFAISTWKTWDSAPRPTAPGSGSELTPWNAHPLVVSATTQAAPIPNRMDLLPIMLAASLLRQALRRVLQRPAPGPGPVQVRRPPG